MRSTTPPAPTSSAPQSGYRSGAHAITSRVVVVLVPLCLELSAGGGEERLLQRRRVVATLEVVGGLEHEQPAAIEDPDPLREVLGLGEVVRAEEDRRIVVRPDLPDEFLHLELRARVETGRRLVQQQHDR